MKHIKNVVFYRHGADYGGRDRLYYGINRAYTYVMLTCMGVCLGLLSLMMVCEYKDIPGLALFRSYMESPGIAFLNILPAVLLLFLLYFITGRAWIAYPVSAFIVLGLSMGDYIKLMVRCDPFVASDMRLLLEAKNMASRYTIDLSWRLYALIIALIFGTVFAAVFMRTPYKSPTGRAALSFVLAAACVLLYINVYDSDARYDSVTNVRYAELNLNQWTKEHKYISRGFLYPFIHSIKEALPNPPPGYSDAAADAIIGRYAADDIPEDKKVNIITVMLESYTDLSRFPEMEISDEVYAPLHHILEESYSGVLVSNTFGGGTTDSERTYLTGYTYAEDFRTGVNSYVRYFSGQGYHTCGFHPGSSWFYNRENVNEYLGFEDYRFIEDAESTSMWDDGVFFDDVREMYDGRDRSRPYFSYNLTYRNHGPYDPDHTEDKEYIKNTGFSDYSYNVLNNYLSGIAGTSAEMESFVQSFEDEEEPVVIIMFGDHMPWMGDSNRVLTELGINFDTGTEDGFYNYYSTIYFIWANEPAKEVLGNAFLGEGEPMSPCFLMPKLFGMCSWKGNELIKAAQELSKELPVINTGSGLYRENGQITAQLSEKAETELSDYLIMQYRLMRESVE